MKFGEIISFNEGIIRIYGILTTSERRKKLLKQITFDKNRAVIKIKDANYPAPFLKSLEFSAPARGTWNIVHTGMLLPESHQIYICAAGCLRVVVLTAAEMGAMDRFSSIEVKELDLTSRDHETFMIEGISHILNNLPKIPRAVLVFTACVHIIFWGQI